MLAGISLFLYYGISKSCTSFLGFGKEGFSTKSGWICPQSLRIMGVVNCERRLNRFPEGFLMGIAVSGLPKVVGELPLDLRPPGVTLFPLPPINYYSVDG